MHNRNLQQFSKLDTNVNSSQQWLYITIMQSPVPRQVLRVSNLHEFCFTGTSACVKLSAGVRSLQDLVDDNAHK
jgi:hypothetical protein